MPRELPYSDLRAVLQMGWSGHVQTVDPSVIRELLAERDSLADTDEGLRRVAEIAGRFHAAYNADDGVEFHGAEELTLDELNAELGEALNAIIEHDRVRTKHDIEAKPKSCGRLICPPSSDCRECD